MKKILVLITALILCLPMKAQYNVDRLITSGRIALHYEDYVLSIQYFNQAILLKPYLYEPWELRAIAKYYLDDWEGAESDITQAIALNPYITSFYDLRGITYIQLKDYDHAIADYTKAIKQEPNDKRFWFNRAVCYMEKKSYDTAQVQLDVMISKWKKYSQPYLMKAEIYLNQKDTANAALWIDKTLALENYNAEAWRMKGHLALTRSKWQQADSCLTKALHYKSKDVSSYINRALARLRINNLRGAMSDYDIALEQDPNNFLAHYNRGLLRQQVGDDNRAIEDFNYVLSLEPGNILALFNRATLLDRTGDLRGAIRDYSTVIKKFPNFWTGLHQRAGCYRRLGMNAQAEMDEFRILKAQMDKHLGIQNRWSKAKLNAMRKLSDIDPEKYNQIVVEDEEETKHEYASSYRGKVQNRQSDEKFQPYIALTMSQRGTDNVSTYIPFTQPTTKYIDEVQRLTKKNDMFRIKLGNVGEGTGSETFTAVDSLSSMIEHSKNPVATTRLMLLRSIAYSTSQDYQDALKDLTTVTSSINTNENYLRYIIQLQKTIAEAMMEEYDKNTSSKDAVLRMANVTADFQELIDMDPDNAIALYCQGTFFARKGDYERAIASFTKAIQADPRMPYAYYNRGLCLLKNGKAPEARQDFSKSGELGLYGAYSLLKIKK